jgi:hypothetical protein
MGPAFPGTTVYELVSGARNEPRAALMPAPRRRAGAGRLVEAYALSFCISASETSKLA